MVSVSSPWCYGGDNDGNCSACDNDYDISDENDGDGDNDYDAGDENDGDGDNDNGHYDNHNGINTVIITSTIIITITTKSLSLLS